MINDWMYVGWAKARSDVPIMDMNKMLLVSDAVMLLIDGHASFAHPAV